MLAELEKVPRLELAITPTPIQETPRLASAIGLDRLLVKRDDNTGLALGGNKARKLEYLVADAAAAGADVLVTLGGPQSNHCRSTAAAARATGMDAHLVFSGHRVDEVQGNLVLDQRRPTPVRDLRRRFLRNAVRSHPGTGAGRKRRPGGRG